MKKIEIGKHYNIWGSPDKYWAKVLEIIPPRTGENTTNFKLVKCIFGEGKEVNFGIIKHFRLYQIKK